MISFSVLNLGTVFVIDCESPYDVVTSPGTTIITPNYPYYYGFDRDCQVTLTFGDRVSIVFEYFSVGFYFTGHLDDWLELHDGDNPDSDLIGKRLRGDNLPSPVESSGNSMTLVFHSDPYMDGIKKAFRILTHQGTLCSTKVKNEQIVRSI